MIFFKAKSSKGIRENPLVFNTELWDTQILEITTVVLSSGLKELKSI